MTRKQAVPSGRFTPLWFVCLCGLAAAGTMSAQFNQLLVSPSTLNFSAASNSTATSSQNFSVSTTISPLTFTLSTQYEQGSTGWLSVSTSSSTTPATVTVTVNPTGLADGTYQALVGVTSGTQGAPVQITLLVAGNVVGGGSALIANPASVTLATQSTLLQSVQITAANGAAVPFSVSSTSNGGSWLIVSPTTGTTPGSISISANTSQLITGTYNGTVSVYPTGGGTPLTINVQLQVGGSGSTGLSVANPSLSFTSGGNSTPAPQADTIFYSGGTATYTATASASWVQLSSDTTSTPAQSVTGDTNTNLTVAVNPAGMSPGTYLTTITVSAANSTVIVNVSLTIGANGVLAAQPASLFFTYQPGGAAPASQTATITTSGTTLNYAVSPTSSGWLQVTPQTGSTPGQITVSVNPAGLSNSTYQGSITVSPVSGTPLTIPVTLTIGTQSSTSLVVNPATIAFQGTPGTNPAPQSISLATLTGSAAQFSAVASSSGAWLSVTPAFGSIPSSLSVSANEAVLPGAGTYQGSITITNLNDNTQVVVSVTLTIGGGQVAVAPSSLAFSQVLGGAAPPAQTLQITSTGTGQVSFTTTASATWLTVNPMSGTTPVGISVTASAAGLAVGNYQGTITINGGATPITVPVTLAVTNAAALSTTPGALSFSYLLGSSATPGPQTINVSSSSGPASFSATAQTNSGGNWLFLAVNGTTTPAALSVLVDPAGLTPGAYNGTVTVSGFNGLSQTLTVPVTLTITAPAAPAITNVVNAASLLPGPVSPGELITIRGSNLGPAAPGVSGVVTPSGAYATSVSGTQVLFDGIAAPLIFVSANQINAVAPYELNNKTTTNVQISVNGVTSTTLALQVAPSAPGIFTANSSGNGQAAIVNQDGSINSASNPAPVGSIVSIYATGEGQTTPSGQDGRIIVTDVRKPLLPVTVKIGGVPATVVYAGSAPGLVSGALQVNVLIDQTIGEGSAVPVQLQVGNAGSPGNVTIAIQ